MFQQVQNQNALLYSKFPKLKNKDGCKGSVISKTVKQKPSQEKQVDFVLHHEKGRGEESFSQVRKWILTFCGLQKEEEILYQNLMALYSPIQFTIFFLIYIFSSLLGEPLNNKLKVVSTLCYQSPDAEVNKNQKKQCEKI